MECLIKWQINEKLIGIPILRKSIEIFRGIKIPQQALTTTSVMYSPINWSISRKNTNKHRRL